MPYIVTRSLTEEMIAVGLLPDECADVEMLMPIDGILQLRYTVNLADDRMALFGECLLRAAGREVPRPPRQRRAIGDP